MNSNKITIKTGEVAELRWAVIEDAHDIAVMELESATYENREEPIVISVEDFTRYWQWRLHSNECPTVVVRGEKMLMGFLSFEKNIKDGFIMALYINPVYMRMGVGTILVGTAENLVRSQHGKGLYVDVEIRNLNGLSFYKKLGFVEDGMASYHLIKMYKEVNDA